MVAQFADERERVAQAVLREFDGLWGGLTEAESGQEVESRVLAWTRQVGRVVLGAVLQAKIEAREREVPNCCGQPMWEHSRQLRTVLTMLGPVTVRRRYYCCRGCGQHLMPVDAWLGWRGGFSFPVEELVAWECSALPYREALESLKKLAGLELSLHAAEDIVARWGGQELQPAPYGERVKDSLVVEIDGTTAHLEDGWREVKVGTFFSWDRTNPQPKPEAVSYVADWRSAAEFAEPLWREALARGAPTAREVAAIGDGAPWIWEMANTLFPRAVEILDWYHACEHLWEAAKVVHGEKSPETTMLVERWKGALWEGHSEGLEEEIRELARTVRDPEKVLRKTADYLQTHQHRLRYPQFRAAGWPIGSGVVEGGCKHVIGLRFKRKSTRWTKLGARAVLHLRLDRLNGRWENRIQHLRLAA